MAIFAIWKFIALLPDYAANTDGNDSILSVKGRLWLTYKNDVILSHLNSDWLTSQLHIPSISLMHRILLSTVKVLDYVCKE